MVAVLEIWVLAIVLVVSLQTQVLVISQNLACNSDDLTGLRGFMDQLESPIDGWPTNSSSCCNWFPRWLLYWRYGYLPLFLWFLFKPRLLLLMQGMRILLSGRKSSLALVLVGVVSFLTSYIPTLLRSLLLEMGIEEDLYNPVCKIWCGSVTFPMLSLLNIRVGKIGLPWINLSFLEVVHSSFMGQTSTWSQMIPDIAFGRHTRVALDVGCGVACFGAYLFSRNVLTMSIAPKDVHENQIQFALERGVPAMVAAFATRRLLYPSQAFDLIHSRMLK